jgi:hypothetical protein
VKLVCAGDGCGLVWEGGGWWSVVGGRAEFLKVKGKEIQMN